MKAKIYICPKCGHKFEVTSFWKWLAAPHLFDIWRWFKCPSCGKSSWIKKEKEQ